MHIKAEDLKLIISNSFQRHLVWHSGQTSPVNTRLCDAKPMKTRCWEGITEIQIHPESLDLRCREILDFPRASSKTCQMSLRMSIRGKREKCVKKHPIFEKNSRFSWFFETDISKTAGSWVTTDTGIERTGIARASSKKISSSRCP